jgi:hypothetical protein
MRPPTPLHNAAVQPMLPPVPAARTQIKTEATAPATGRCPPTPRRAAPAVAEQRTPLPSPLGGEGLPSSRQALAPSPGFASLSYWLITSFRISPSAMQHRDALGDGSAGRRGRLSTTQAGRWIPVAQSA